MDTIETKNPCLIQITYEVLDRFASQLGVNKFNILMVDGNSIIGFIYNKNIGELTPYVTIDNSSFKFKVKDSSMLIYSHCDIRDLKIQIFVPLALSLSIYCVKVATMNDKQVIDARVVMKKSYSKYIKVDTYEQKPNLNESLLLVLNLSREPKYKDVSVEDITIYPINEFY